MKYKRKFSRFSFNNLHWIVRIWCELALGNYFLDECVYWVDPSLDLIANTWIVLKIFQAVFSLRALIVWELIPDE